MKANIYTHTHIYILEETDLNVSFWESDGGSSYTRCGCQITRLHSQLLNYYLQPRTACMGTDLEPSPTCVQKHVATRSINVELDVCV
jgi:hypothetical protein